ncbi:catalase family peroxidase [Methylobacterium sp. NEAU 140]|uniref:catalase family peroxidase n=1 Tax=Methylobacterium sp. NEAU 140 TaxID=3064945 RepID=UPI0027343BA1|nr:catalase family peroxidase [Methylobacterium sp. NEAU 140]MDP4024093.1 catalase family peroxidase [Methylobacterium sp. NEAU 140]
MHRRTTFGAVAGLALALAAGLPAAAQDASTAEQTVDVMNTLWGKHPGFRANHAKGTVVEGSFTPSREAATYSKASLFAGPTVPVTVRFSDATGLPLIADGAKSANPHGLAVKFKLAEGGEMDVVVNALKYFPVATGEEFRDLLTAASRSKPDSPKPTPVERFIAAHPAAGTAGSTAGTPSSLARQTFNGVNAFVLVDTAGKRQAFRWRFVPVAGEDLLTPEDAEKQAPGFLMDEIRARLARTPVAYRVLAQLAQAGDATNDATKPWPDDRPTVEMGTLTLTKPVADSAEAEKALLFLPNALADGVEVSDDPLIDARVQAYAVSFSRRQP